MSFEPFNFRPELLNAIEQAKFTRASKIQQLVIPEIINGKDLLVSAHSGSGKSASFVLPLIQRLLETPRKQITEEAETNDDEDESSRPIHGPRALILTPTRELANQVSACIRRFTKELDLRYGILVGGAPYPPQVRMLKKPVDFLVATPGRLLDHIKNNRVNFDFVEFLVIDECNRLVDMGITEEIREIIQQLPGKNASNSSTERQTLIFSDSLDSSEIDLLSSEVQNNPVRFQLSRSKQSYRSLNQSMYIADEGEHKFRLIHALIQQSESSQLYIFSASLDRLNTLQTFLCEQTEYILEKELKLTFQEKNIFLCCDENETTLPVTSNSTIQIFHLDLPDDLLIFLQRLNLAIDNKTELELAILVGQDEWSILHQIERYIGKTLARKKIEGLEPESSEPSVRSSLNNQKNDNSKDSQTKNRNPYSGRRQSNGNNTTNKNKTKHRSKQNNQSQTKRNHKKGGQNRPKNPNAQPQNNFNVDPFLDDRDMSWKTYISNMSNGKNPGNAGRGNKGKGRNRNRHSSNNFDLNNSPMAISAKAVREMSNDEWIEETETKKPSVQIRVKGQNRNVQNDYTPGEKPYSEIEDRIDGKLGINK